MYCSISCGTKDKYETKLKPYSAKGGRSRKSKQGEVIWFDDPFRFYTQRCKGRKAGSNLTPSYLEKLWNEQNGTCPYSKIKLQLSTYRHPVRDKRIAASLDRIDCTKGYIEGNVQFVSTLINFMKYQLTDAEVKGFIAEIIKNHTGGFMDTWEQNHQNE
jgi:hypothetical protein